MIGDAFYDVCQGKMFPAISLKKPTEKVKANFGQEPFVFDIVQMMMVGAQRHCLIAKLRISLGRTAQDRM